jgi:hypothetical protein
MSYFLFIDESGQDHHDSPYEVLVGFAIEDKDLWRFIQEVHNIEMDCFGRRYRLDGREIKAKKFLNVKTFRLAAQLEPINLFDRVNLAKAVLDEGRNSGRIKLTALAQAKLAYTKEVLRLCAKYRCRIFASIINDPTSIPGDKTMLRSDYVYLFERFYYFLEDKPAEQRGIVVFDELEKSQSHILVSQMDRYFKHTQKGRIRSSLVIPEPFFVHSDLTTGIQVVDFIAYILSWNFRFGKLTKAKREELNGFAELLKPLRYRTTREIGTIRDHEIWSICVV